MSSEVPLEYLLRILITHSKNFKAKKQASTRESRNFSVNGKKVFGEGI